jgi:hypothetical protein
MKKILCRSIKSLPSILVLSFFACSTSGDGKIDAVSDPVFSVAAGSYSSSQTVEIITATAGATIKYTSDGTDPSTSSTAISGSSVTVSASLTLKAYAQKSGMKDSGVVSAAYIISTTSTDPTGVQVVVRETPVRAMLVVDAGSTDRFAFGMGPALQYNTWTPWKIEDANPAWMSFVAEAGKTYSVYWDDSYQGSYTNGFTTYSLDIKVAGYASDKTTRLSGWSSDVDSGYSTAQSLSVTTTQLVYIKVVSYYGGNTGTFAIRVVEAGSSSGDSYAWYQDGAPIPGATNYVYTVSPASLATGTHRFTCVGSRNGATFSETTSVTR